MLGRLKMTIGECISCYEEFMKQVFPPGKHWYPKAALVDIALKGEKWDSGKLEEVIKKLIEKKLGQPPDDVLLQDENEPDPPCKV